MAETGPLERLRAGSAPRGLRMAIAEGMVPLDDIDLIEAISILCTDPDSAILDALEENLPTMPRSVLINAVRDHSASPELLEFIARIYKEDDELLMGIVLNKMVSNQTLIRIAGSAPGSILTLLSENKQRMQNCRELLDALLANDDLPRAIKYSLIEFKETWANFVVQDEPKLEMPVQSPPVKTPDLVAAEVASVIETSLPDTIELTAEEIQAIELEIARNDVLPPLNVQPQKPAAKTEKPASKKDKSVLDGWDLDEMIDGLAPDQESGTLDDSSDDFYGLELVDMDAEEKEAKKTGHLDGWDNLEISEEFDDVATKDADTDDLDDAKDEFAEDEILDTRIRLSKLTASDKLVMATMGTKQERMILVRDPNKKVAVAVVSGPKMSEFEIQLIAQNRSVCEDVLREIYSNRVWGSVPSIRKDLALNPKTPLGISLRIINSLNDNDLKEVMKSKDLPYGLTSSAKRIFEMRESRRQRRAK